MNPVYDKPNEDTAEMSKVMAHVDRFYMDAIQRIIDFVQWEPMRTVKEKDAMLGYSINE